MDSQKKNQPGAPISKRQAKAWIKKYRDKHKHDPKVVYSEWFGKDIIQKLLKEDKCEGIRIYNSYDEKDNLQFLIVAVDENGKDILPGDFDEDGTDKNMGQQRPIIIDAGTICPPDCGGDGGLSEDE